MGKWDAGGGGSPVRPPAALYTSEFKLRLDYVIAYIFSINPYHDSSPSFLTASATVSTLPAPSSSPLIAPSTTLPTFHDLSGLLARLCFCVRG